MVQSSLYYDTAIMIRITSVTNLAKTVAIVRNVNGLPIGEIVSKIKEQRWIILHWNLFPSQPGRRPDVLGFLDSLIAIGAKVEVDMWKKSFDRNALQVELTRRETETNARDCELMDIHKLKVEARDPDSPILQAAREELKSRGVDLERFLIGLPCIDHYWEYESDSYHRCSICFVKELHDWKISMDDRGYGHKCSNCGFFEQD